MNLSNCKWKKTKILEKYCKCLLALLHEKDEKTRSDLALDKIVLEDIIFFDTIYPFIPIPISKLENEKNLPNNRIFFENKLTKYQKETIQKYINACLKKYFKLYYTEDSTYDSNNLLDDTNEFLTEISSKIKNLFLKSLNESKISIKKSKFERPYVGITYSLNNDNYFKVFDKKNDSSMNFYSLNHELLHGFINIASKRKFEKEDKIILYREVASILIEFYAIDYLYKNKKINFNEYLYAFNKIFSSYAEENIEISYLLLSFASNKELNNTIADLEKFVDKEKEKINIYGITTDELTEFTLKHHLIYLYSFFIANALYYNFRNDKKQGIDAAIDIMLNVSETNEEELLKKYNLNPLESFYRYVDENNKLVDKVMTKKKQFK